MYDGREVHLQNGKLYLKMSDGSYYDKERIDKCRGRIKLYYEIKQNNMFDDFYREHLSMFEEGLDIMESLLNEVQQMLDDGKLIKEQVGEDDYKIVKPESNAKLNSALDNMANVGNQGD